MVVTKEMASKVTLQCGAEAQASKDAGRGGSLDCPRDTLAQAPLTRDMGTLKSSPNTSVTLKLLITSLGCTKLPAAFCMEARKIPGCPLATPYSAYLAAHRIAVEGRSLMMVCLKRRACREMPLWLWPQKVGYLQMQAMLALICCLAKEDAQCLQTCVYRVMLTLWHSSACSGRPRCHQSPAPAWYTLAMQ